MPIPMHWAKRLMRGVNSAEIFAECLGDTFGVPVVRTTRSAALYWSTERFAAARAISQCPRGLSPRPVAAAVAGSRLLLVDDILTTGATCSEVARLLKQAGAVGRRGSGRRPSGWFVKRRMTYDSLLQSLIRMPPP